MKIIPQHFNRKSRRRMMKARKLLGSNRSFLYKKRKINLETNEVSPGFEDWCEILRENIRVGKLSHRRYTEEIQKLSSEYYVNKESTIRKNLSEVYSETELDTEVNDIINSWKLWPKKDFIEDPYEESN